MEYLKEEEPELPKILFTGLDDAGKSSIILSLQREFSKIAFLSPTRGAQRRIFEFLGRQIAEWDLGGQQVYRIAYIKNPSKYFENTEILIYVIDVQNKERIPEAVSYLSDVVTQLRKLNIIPPICVFLHKMDPKLYQAGYDEYIKLITELQENIKKVINYEKIYFYHTSIYDFSTIVRAMSEILLALYPKSQLIENTLKEFASKINCDGITLMDNNSLIVGTYYIDEETKKLLNSSTPYFLTLNDSFQTIGNKDDQLEDQILVHRFGKYILFKKLMLSPEHPYYLIIIKKKQTFYKDDYSSLIQLLAGIIYK